MRLRYLPLLLTFSLFITTAIAQEIKLEDIWYNGTYNGKGASGFRVMNDGESYALYELGENKVPEVNRYSISSRKKVETLFTALQKNRAGETVQLEIRNYEFSQDEKRVLIQTNFQQIYRHSYAAVFHVIDRKEGILYSSDFPVRYATFSPDGQKVAFVQENNLFILDIATQQTQQITMDGLPNMVINGAVDWVYEEEFSMSKGFEWSPDGKYIAFYRFDENGVKEFSMDIYGSLYPQQERWKYPKAGEANSSVTVHVYSLESAKRVQCVTGTGPDVYLPRIKWTDQPGVLSIQQLNRHQNEWTLLFANANDGNTQVVYQETSKTYVDITDNLVFEKGSFIFTSERSGFNHLYRYEISTKKLTPITKGNWDVDAFYGYDSKSNTVYYNAANELPTQRNIFSSHVKTGKQTQLNEQAGWNTAVFTKGYKYFLHTYSNFQTPPVYVLRKSNGKQVHELENNQALKEKLAQTSMGTSSFGTLTTDQGVNLHYYQILPPDFDASKKYPVLMYVYGGPGSQTVKDQWSASYYMWFNYLAQKGYVVVSVDNRGTGARGEEFKKCTYLQLGKYEIEDQIGAAKVIGDWAYVDEDRIGIWGWSFGGYMSSLGITKGNEVFKCAVAVAPVTNWRYYDNIYTERFMRTPQENGASYDENSPINHVSKIKGAYLIIHGTADDNVHFQNAVEMVNAMIEKNIPFDSEFYPNKNHGIGGGYARLHLFKRISEYLFENL